MEEKEVGVDNHRRVTGLLIAVAAVSALFCFKGMEELIRNGRIKNNEAY